MKINSVTVRYGELRSTGYPNARQELLRRLEQGDRAIKACKEIATMEIPE